MAITVPTVLLGVILLGACAAVLYVYLKRKSKIHSEVLVENNDEAEDAEMGRRVTSRTERSSSHNSRGSNRVSPAPNNSTTVSHSSRPPASPEPKEFLPNVDTDGRVSGSGHLEGK